MMHHKASDDGLWEVYDIKNTKSPIKYICHGVLLDDDGGYGEINGVMEFEFKSNPCLSVDDIEKITGKSL